VACVGGGPDRSDISVGHGAARPEQGSVEVECNQVPRHDHTVLTGRPQTGDIIDADGAREAPPGIGWACCADHLTDAEEYRFSMDPTSPDLLTVSEERARARHGVKWQRYGPDVIPSWVADMDFDPPHAVLETIQGHLDRGDLGYGRFAHELAPAYAEWQHRRHGWRPDHARVRPFTSALHALEFVLWNTTSRGDGVVVFTPIYYPFLDAIADSGRRRIECRLDPDGWRLDPARLESCIDATTRVVLFCNPHNPTGRVFDTEEVAAVATVAQRHDLLVITDEIWGELLHPGSTHCPLAAGDERFAGRLVTLGSASKTFNLAGLRTAVAHIDHPPLVDVIESMAEHQNGSPSSLGVAATITAWTGCDDWLTAAQRTITANRDHLACRLGQQAPIIGLDAPAATHLPCLDFS